MKPVFWLLCIKINKACALVLILKYIRRVINNICKTQIHCMLDIVIKSYLLNLCYSIIYHNLFWLALEIIFGINNLPRTSFNIWKCSIFIRCIQFFHSNHLSVKRYLRYKLLGIKKCYLLIIMWIIWYKPVSSEFNHTIITPCRKNLVYPQVLYKCITQIIVWFRINIM